MRRFRNEMRFFILENLRRIFFVFRLNITKFSLIFINFSTRFETWYCECCWENVNSNDERKKKNHYWWLMRKVEKTKIVIEIKWALMRKKILKVLTKILTKVLKTRILWIKNSLIYTSFFFLDLILNCFADKHIKIKHHSFFSRLWFERRRNRKRRWNERKEFTNSFLNRWHHDFLFSLVHLVILIAINVTLIDEFLIIRARSASRRKWVNLTNYFRFFAIFTRDDCDDHRDIWVSI